MEVVRIGNKKFFWKMIGLRWVGGLIHLLLQSLFKIEKGICPFKPMTTILLLGMLVFKLEILFYLAAITTVLNPPGIYYHLEK